MTDWTKLLGRIAIDIVFEAQKIITENDSNASWNLHNSFDYHIRDNIIEISALHYADYLDTGTGPRKPNGGPGFLPEIKEWVRYKGIDSGAAWPIYKSILAKGTKPHPWKYKVEEYIMSLEDDALQFLSTVVEDEFIRKFERSSIWVKK